MRLPPPAPADRAASWAGFPSLPFRYLRSAPAVPHVSRTETAGAKVPRLLRPTSLQENTRRKIARMLIAPRDSMFPAPFVSSVMRVEPAWIDYNGHLNMAYYNVLLDRAVDEVFELLGCGLDYVKEYKHSFFTAEAHVRYLRELHAEMPVRVTFQLLEFDSKRMH